MMQFYDENCKCQGNLTKCMHHELSLQDLYTYITYITLIIQINTQTQHLIAYAKYSVSVGAAQLKYKPVMD
jgi:hypothetical protein